MEGARSKRECDLEQAGLTVIQREALNVLREEGMDQLTSNKTLELPAGYELDTVIAEKVMGFKLLTVQEMRAEAEEVWKTQPGCAVFSRGFEARKFYWGTEFKNIISRYSADIVAAWEALNRIGARFEVVLVGNDHGDRLWRATARGIHVGEAETAPLAICRAALLCVLT